MVDAPQPSPEPDPPDPDFAAWVESLGPPADPPDGRPVVYFNRDGDQIEVYLDNVSYYGRWLGGGLVVHLEEGTGRVVGVTIVGIKSGMRKGELRVATRKLKDS